MCKTLLMTGWNYGLLAIATAATAGQPLDPPADDAASALPQVVAAAFQATHDGWSSDEVLLQDELNRRFIEHCRRDAAEATAFDLNWQLLTLRKAGKLKDVPVTRRRRDRHEAYRHAAEIAARFMEDQTGQNIDRVLCHPQWRQSFDAVASKLSPETDRYRLRKAALALRKSRRLQPELIDRVSDWGRRIVVQPVSKWKQDLDSIPEQPGIYIFRDATGYLYIGESSRLRQRIKTHLGDSDRDSLANYLRKQSPDAANISLELHIFDAQSAARKTAARRAYESELIRTRRPRSIVRP